VGVSSTGGDGTIENVNITGPVAKAYLYWIGANIPAADVSTDDTVYFGVEGMPGTDVMADNSYVIPFERPFAPGAFFWNANHSAFVADVTQLIQPGMNNYSITEFDMDIEFGVGLQVVYEDDSAPLSEIAIHQGHDFAFLGWNNAEELNRTDVVTHTFAPTDFDRVLQVTFFSGGGEDTDRPDQLWSLTGIHDDPGDLPDELITNNLGNVIDTNPLEADNGERVGYGGQRGADSRGRDVRVVPVRVGRRQRYQHATGELQYSLGHVQHAGDSRTGHRVAVGQRGTGSAAAEACGQHRLGFSQ
jgi:hypothetical protein